MMKVVRARDADPRRQLLLDMAGIHRLTARRTLAGLELVLEPPSGDRRSAVETALVRQLRVRLGRELHRFSEATRSVPIAAPGDGAPRDVELLLTDEVVPGDLPVSLATIVVGGTPSDSDSDADSAKGVHLLPRADCPRYLLSPFELRYAADMGGFHRIPLAARLAGPANGVLKTDLHTHFAGCVGADDLVRLGAEAGVFYPRALLEEARFQASEDLDLGSLSGSLRERIARRLEVPLDRRVTFLDMERVYRLRAPLTKAPPMFLPLLRTIAADYARVGVRYVELSLGSVVEAKVLRLVHQELPRIEEESGVTLRFLAAISRHDDPEWDLDLLERIKALAGSAYLVGVDVMGHETNSTTAFSPLLRSFRDWASRERPGFVIRVHAGESPSHPENVRLALEAAAGPEIELRIGHGLFGVDDETLEAIVRAKAIVEFNLDSNVALNHLQSARAVPLRRYVDAGVRIVLGSDGYGIYQTSPEALVRAAALAGLDRERLTERVGQTEEAYIALAMARDRERRRAALSFVVPPDVPPVHFTPAVVERRRAALAKRDRTLEARLHAIDVALLEPEALTTLIPAGAGAGIVLLSIAGAWRTSWDALTEDGKRTIECELDALIAGVDRRAVLVTGGTRHGVEGHASRAAARRGLAVIGAIVRETPPEALEKGTMTHAVIVGETLYDKADGLYALVAAHDGACLFFAGGQIVSDEIQTAKNLRLRLLLLDGAGGASERHAREEPVRAFRSAAEALHALRGWRALGGNVAPHWFDGPNPTVDLVVIRDDGAGDRQILLVLRDLDAPAEPGKWALPGGFVATDAPRGGRWRPGQETTREAAVRELEEETGLRLTADQLREIGVYEGAGRDPRDTARSFSQSTVFLVTLTAPAAARLPIGGGDDAADAAWFPLGVLPRDLAFDHRTIIADASALLLVAGP
jgi:ADP-ribose pyrophosphatase YjhB (NUDIX family)